MVIEAGGGGGFEAAALLGRDVMVFVTWDCAWERDDNFYFCVDDFKNCTVDSRYGMLLCIFLEYSTSTS